MGGVTLPTKLSYAGPAPKWVKLTVAKYYVSSACFFKGMDTSCVTGCHSLNKQTGASRAWQQKTCP